MGLLDYFKDYMKPTPTQQMANFANALRPAPPPMLARPAAAPKTVYTAPRVPWAPSVATGRVAAPAAPVYRGGGGVSPQVAAANAAQAKADAAEAKAKKEAKDRSRKENAATKALVDQQVGLSAAFGKQRDKKLENISKTFTTSDANLLKGYGQALGGLRESAKDNDKSESDSSFQNVANAARERQDVVSQVGDNGGGETDILKAQLAALRNYSTNQSEINRSFFDTLGSINRSITSLNVDTATSRNGLWSQSEADREAAWANYYNQQADTWTQITNIENSNNNTDSSTSVAYKKTQPNSGKTAATYAGANYSKKANSTLDKWSGKGAAEIRKPTSINAAATVNLGGPMKRAEGATLRKW